MKNLVTLSTMFSFIYLYLTKEFFMPLTTSQKDEFIEYLETILDLYEEEEYKDLVEDIVYHYCKRKFDIEREESVGIFYEILKDLK